MFLVPAQRKHEAHTSDTEPGKTFVNHMQNKNRLCQKETSPVALGRKGRSSCRLPSSLVCCLASRLAGLRPVAQATGMLEQSQKWLQQFDNNGRGSRRCSPTEPRTTWKVLANVAGKAFQEQCRSRDAAPSKLRSRQM